MTTQQDLHNGEDTPRNGPGSYIARAHAVVVKMHKAASEADGDMSEAALVAIVNLQVLIIELLELIAFRQPNPERS